MFLFLYYIYTNPPLIWWVCVFKGELIISKRNEGKIFEDAFIKSVPDYCWHKRLNDNASSWANGTKTRFTSTNECDFLINDFKRNTFYALELKTTKGSLTFWRKDFEIKDKKQSFQIKKNQILGLQKWSKFCMNCGFIINFRECNNRTFFVDIGEFVDYTSAISKKSINIDDVLNMNPIEIESKLLKVNYKYLLDAFLENAKL